VLGKDDFDIFAEPIAEKFRANDISVIRSGRETWQEEKVTSACGKVLTHVSFKKPLLDDSKNIIGVIGMTFTNSILKPSKEIITNVNKLKLNSHFSVNSAIEKDKLQCDSIPGLSRREQQCLYHFARGKTAKETALLLNLSFRTVEAYIFNLKKKLGCRHKRDLLKLYTNQ